LKNITYTGQQFAYTFIWFPERKEMKLFTIIQDMEKQHQEIIQLMDKLEKYIAEDEPYIFLSETKAIKNLLTNRASKEDNELFSFLKGLESFG
jgi:hypothetical protein